MPVLRSYKTAAKINLLIFSLNTATQFRADHTRDLVFDMHFHLATACSLLALADTAFAHYRWTNLMVNGAKQGADYQYVRLNTNYNSPVTDVTSNDIRCNTGTQANAGKTSTFSVAAGSAVGLGLDQPIYHQSVTGVFHH